MATTRYLTFDEYKEYGYSKPATEQEFNSLENEVQIRVDAMTFGAVKKHFNSLAGTQAMEDLKLAVAVQIDHVINEFGSRENWLNAKPLSSKSETIGNYSQSVAYANNQGVLDEAKTINWSNVSYAYLAPFVAIGRELNR